MGVVVDFEREPDKAQATLQKHGVAFPEAATVFGDPLALSLSDPEQAVDEDRCGRIAPSSRTRLLVVA